MGFAIGTELSPDGVKVIETDNYGGTRAVSPIDAARAQTFTRVSPPITAPHKAHAKLAMRTSHRFVSSFDDWQEVSALDYSYGISEPASAMPLRHRVFGCKIDGGLEVRVSSLEFMKAFFQPHPLVLPAAFTAINIDRLSFQSITAEGPVVQTMKGRHCFTARELSANLDRHVLWLQTSRSGRACAQSVHSRALEGWLDLSLPKGNFELTAHGVLAGQTLYATRVVLNTVAVPGDDSVTGRREVFNLDGRPAQHWPAELGLSRC